MDPTNPLMQLLMRTLFRPPQEQAQPKPVEEDSNYGAGRLRAPLLDSLTAIVGRPLQYRWDENAWRTEPGLLGYVDSDKPSVVNYTHRAVASGQRRFDATLVHEAGHSADFLGSIPTSVSLDVYKDWRNARKQDPFYSKTYGGKAFSGMEPVAEAFKASYYFLQETQNRPEIARQLLGQLERVSPGTRTLVHWMLQNELYDKHPLQRKLRSTSVNKLFSAADSVASSRIPTEVR